MQSEWKCEGSEITKEKAIDKHYERLNREIK